MAIVFGLIFITIFATVIRFVWYAPVGDTSTYQDQIPVDSSSISTIFCDSVQVENEDNYGNMYLHVFPHTPPLTLWQTFNVTEDLTIDPNALSYNYFYMSQQSQVNVELCAQPSILLYVFWGDINFESWRHDDDYDVVFHNRYSGPCLNGTNGFASIDVGSNDGYYVFAIKNDNLVNKTDINMTLAFNRTMYNISAMSGQACHVNPTCSLPLNFVSSQFPLIVTNGTVYSANQFNSTLTCSPRNWFYGVAFVLPAGLLLAITIVICIKRCRQKPTEDSARLLPKSNSKKDVLDDSHPNVQETTEM